MSIRAGWIISKIKCRFVNKKRGYEIMNKYYRGGGATSAKDAQSYRIWIYVKKNCSILGIT